MGVGDENEKNTNESEDVNASDGDCGTVLLLLLLLLRTIPQLRIPTLPLRSGYEPLVPIDRPVARAHKR